MHKQLILSLFICAGCFSFYSCNTCNFLDCVASNFHGQFRVVRKTDGKDLVFGPGAIYDKTAIKFYTLTGTDTTFLNYSPIKFPGTGYDSILFVYFFPKVTTPVYMRLNNSDTDTLSLTYNTYDTKCCGTITEISNFLYNNTINIPGNRGTEEIKK